MKKIITLFIMLLSLWNTATAQCTVSAFAVHLKSVTIVGNNCVANFDLSWQQENNNGLKFAVLHLWRTDQYPSLEKNGLAYTSTSDHPDPADLALALGNIVIEGHGTPEPFIGNIYYPYPDVPVLSEGLSISMEDAGAGMHRMTIKNITLTIPDCGGTSITGDIWLSNTDHGQGVHCVNSGYSVVIGNPVVSGSLVCIVPHQYELSIKNAGAEVIDVTYDVYVDEGDANYEPIVHDQKVTEVPQGPFNIAPGDTYSSGKLTYFPWSANKPFADHGLWVEVSAVNMPNKAIYFIPNPCAPLAVSYTSLAAMRDRNEVKLMWQTSTEANNFGFEIQRRTGTAPFCTVAFVPSKAINGNSTSGLYYIYTDLNTEKYITEYRLKQIDLDQNFKLSQVVAVRGDKQTIAHMAYPNPATNNRIKLLLNEWNGTYDIDLVDVSGRIIKKIPDVKTQSLEISQVPAGIYMLRIINKATGEVVSERVVVHD